MTHVVRSLVPDSIVLSDAQETIARQVFGPRRWRPFDPRPGANVTITPDAMSYVIASTPGAATPDDASLIGAGQVYSIHSPHLPEVRAGSNITITRDALGYIISAAGGGALAFGRVDRDNAGNYTTISTTFVDVDTTNVAVTITTGARRCRVTVVANGYSSNAAFTVALDIAIDGTREGNDLGLIFTNNSDPISLSFSHITGVLTAASHTFRIQWKVSNAGTTGNLYASTATTKLRLMVEELNLIA